MGTHLRERRAADAAAVHARHAPRFPCTPSPHPPPSRPPQAIYWGTMATCLAVLVVGGNMKPDTSIITWARQEAERREQA